MSDVIDLTLEAGQVVNLTVSIVGAPGPTGPAGDGAEDPPVDLTVLFENALA